MIICFSKIQLEVKVRICPSVHAIIHFIVLTTVWITGLILAKLCTDIEKNPGPSVYVDATKTINVPYCQGNVTVLGKNAGQQCVAMSLCAFIYSKIKKITSADDMTQIMVVGIQLYSSLSLLARQSMLMLTVARNGYSVWAIFPPWIQWQLYL